MTAQTTKDQILKRIARVEGQLRGVQKLIAEEADCEKIAQQMTAARKALEKSHHLLLTCMIEEHIQETKSSPMDKDSITLLLSKYL